MPKLTAKESMEAFAKVAAPFVRNPYNYDTNQASDESGLDTGTEGGAKQSFKEEVDINTIVKRFGLGHELPAHHRIPEYGDFTGIDDFQSAMNATSKARDTFMELPAELRARFQNDPGQYVAFCLNPKNRDELKELGLLSPEALERDRTLEAERKQAENTARNEQKGSTTNAKGKVATPPQGSDNEG